MKSNLKRKNGLFLFVGVAIYIFSWVFQIKIWYLIIPIGFLFIMALIVSNKSAKKRKDRKNRFKSFAKGSQGDYYDWLVSD
ncbi:hypothetical protein [Candidatus Lokiarchaeum ossiferum]|uniref:hypothetical protein n=1 Tax=Candidatus Lokiarchaeum ossiferum TaxID=2951803 RepID=UPI00352EC57F